MKNESKSFSTNGNHSHQKLTFRTFILDLYFQILENLNETLELSHYITQ